MVIIPTNIGTAISRRALLVGSAGTVAAAALVRVPSTSVAAVSELLPGQADAEAVIFAVYPAFQIGCSPAALITGFRSKLRFAGKASRDLLVQVTRDLTGYQSGALTEDTAPIAIERMARQLLVVSPGSTAHDELWASRRPGSSAAALPAKSATWAPVRTDEQHQAARALNLVMGLMTLAADGAGEDLASTLVVPTACVRS